MAMQFLPRTDAVLVTDGFDHQLGLAIRLQDQDLEELSAPLGQVHPLGPGRISRLDLVQVELIKVLLYDLQHLVEVRRLGAKHGLEVVRPIDSRVFAFGETVDVGEGFLPESSA